METQLHKTIAELGFKGKTLSDLQAVITNEDILHSLYNFIILNDGMSKLMIAKKFTDKIRNEGSFDNYDSYVDAVYECETSDQLIEQCAKLLCVEKYHPRLTDFLDLFEHVALSQDIYDQLVKFRGLYSLEEIITLYKTIHVDKLDSLKKLPLREVKTIA